MIVADARVVTNTHLAEGLWHIEFQVEGIPESVIPGQYVHLRMTSRPEHILRRPFSVHRVFVDDREFDGLAITYQVVGEATARMTELKPGDTVDLLGPLGNGFKLPVRAKRALFVGGGVGWAPLAMAAGSIAAFGVETHLLVGARNADLVNALSVGVADRPYPLNSYGSPAETGASYIHIATDDGSLGFHGFNTELLEGLMDEYQFDYIATCGPEAMQCKVAEAALERGIVCEVSLERRMACGMGVCLSCTIMTTAGSQKVCSDGPVFNAAEMIW